MATVGFSQDNSLPLMADIQYMEPYASSALNRKFKNILLAGFYSGYIPLPGSGLNVLITSAQSAGGLGTGVASIDTNGFQISVQQNADITVPLAAGKSYIIALQADYQFGTVTNQVDANSTVQASQLVTLDISAKLQSNQIELCRVVVPAGAKQITKAMISTLYRIDRLIGITLSDRIDLADSNTGASSQAVKTAYETAVKYADDNKAAIGVNSDITDLNAIKSLGKNGLAIGGYVSINNGMAVTAESRFSSGGFTDPYVGRALAIKASGGMAVGGDVFFNNALTVKGGVTITNGASITGDLNVDDVTITGTVVGAMPSRALPPNYSDAVWHKIANIPNAGAGANWLTLMLTAGNYGGTQMGHDVLSFTGRNMPTKDTPWTNDVAQKYVNHVQLMTATANAAQIGVVANIVGGVYQSFDFYIKSSQWWSGATVSITGGTGYNFYGNNLTSVKAEPTGIQYITPVTALTTLSPKYDLSQADMNLNSLNLNNPLSVQSGGTGARNATDARNNLGLGSAAVCNIGTSGRNVPLLNSSNTWDTPQTFDDGMKVNDEITSSSANAFRLVSSGNGAILRKDNGTFFFLVATDNNGLGSWNALRPLQISMSTGLLQSSNGQVFGGNTTINDTLTLKNALTMSSGGTGANNLADARSNLQLDRLRQGDTETQLMSAKGTNYLYVSETSWGAFVAGKGFLALGIAQGGTGATDVAGARNNLGLGSAALMTSSTANYDGLTGKTNEAASTTQLVQLRDAAAQKAQANVFGPMQSFQGGVALPSAPGGNANSNGIFNGPTDGAAYDKYNLELRSWYGIGLRDTSNNKTNIFFNVRDGSMGMTGGINASGLTTSSDITAGGYSITNKEFISKGQNGLRIANGGSGILLRKDGNTFYILSVADDANTTTWNTLRPFAIDVASGRVTMANGQILAGGQTLSGNTTINDTLTLANALAISSGGTGAKDAAGARNNLGLGSAALMTTSSATYDNLSGLASESASTAQLVQLRNAAALKGQANTFGPVQSFQGGVALPSAPGGQATSNGLFNGPADGSDYSKYNVELRTWWGLALRDTCNNKTNIVFDARTGDMDTVGTVNTQNLNVAGNFLTLIGSGTSNAQLGSGSSDIYLYNTKSAKHLQLKDDGTLQYENQMIYHTGNKPSMQELLNSDETTGNLQTISTGDDLNDYKTCGMWVCRSVNTNATNAPVTNARYNLTVIHAGVSENGTTQIAYVSSDAARPRVYVRCYSNKTWSLWVDMASNVFPNGATVKQNLTVDGGDLTVNTGYFRGIDNYHYLYVGTRYSNVPELGTWGGYFGLKDTNTGTTTTKFESGKITTLGNILAASDNSMISIGNDGDFALVKKSGTKAKIMVGNGTPFIVTLSNAATVDPSNTQTDLFRVDTDGSGTFKNNVQVNGSRITVVGAGTSNLNIGSGSADVYLQNSKTNKFLQLSDDGFLRYSGSKVYHEGNKPTTAELGFSIDNNRYYNANDDKRKWVRVATVNIPQGGQCAYLTIVGGAGYNAGSKGQAAKTEIILRAGNGSPANSITAVAYVQGSTPIDPAGGFGWKFTSGNNYEIWANVRNYTQGHIVEGRASSGVLIDYTDAAQTDEPDGLTDGTIYYMQYGDALGQSYTKDESDGRYIEATGDTMRGPLTFANATWNPFGDDVEIGDINQGGSLGIRSRNDTNKTGFAFYQKGASSPSGWMQCFSDNVNFTNDLKTAGDFTAAGYSYTNKEFISKGQNGLRIANSGNGVLLRKDSGTFYLLTTTDDSSSSGWTGLRPLAVDIASGRVTMANSQILAGGQTLTGGQTLSGNTTINDTLTLANALAISNGGTGSNNLDGARTNLQVDRIKQASSETQVFASGGKNYLYVNDNGWGAYTAGGGFLALAIGQGGTGATDAAGARNNLGLAAGALMTKSTANYDGLSGSTNEAATTTQLVQLRNAAAIKGQSNTFGPTQNFQNGVYLPNAPGGNAGMFNGPGDGAAWGTYNVEVRSWYGIGFRDTCNNKTNIVFDTRTGNIWTTGGINTSGITSGGNITIAWGGRGHSYQENGDIVEQQGTASIFRGFWSATSLSGALRNITNRADDAWNKANDGQVNRVQDIRLAGQDFIYAGRNVGQVRAPGGAVLVGAEVNGEWDNNERLMYAYIQKLVNGNWYTIGQA